MVDLREDSCLNKLIESKENNCTKINANHIKAVEDIEPGTLLLNDFKRYPDDRWRTHAIIRYLRY